MLWLMTYPYRLKVVAPPPPPQALTNSDKVARSNPSAGRSLNSLFIRAGAPLSDRIPDAQIDAEARIQDEEAAGKFNAQDAMVTRWSSRP